MPLKRSIGRFKKLVGFAENQKKTWSQLLSKFPAM